MNKDYEYKVHLGTTDSGEWLAATSEAPYFCFIASSEQEAIALAKRAIRFYVEVNDASIKNTSPATKSLLSFYPHKKVNIEDCVAA
jgi:predicted RNase H-like HicB family nuclease